MLKWREPGVGLCSNKHHLYFSIILRSVSGFSCTFVYFEVLAKITLRFPSSIQAAIWFQTFVISPDYYFLIELVSEGNIRFVIGDMEEIKAEAELYVLLGATCLCIQ